MVEPCRLGGYDNITQELWWRTTFRLPQAVHLHNPSWIFDSLAGTDPLLFTAMSSTSFQLIAGKACSLEWDKWGLQWFYTSVCYYCGNMSPHSIWIQKGTLCLLFPLNTDLSNPFLISFLRLAPSYNALLTLERQKNAMWHLLLCCSVHAVVQQSFTSVSVDCFFATWPQLNQDFILVVYLRIHSSSFFLMTTKKKRINKMFSSSIHWIGKSFVLS